ncbi:hypothetical protein C8J57DRAFT_1292881 [Mycena rebaudengoi]|nr:hypothetical protein C8J57DRAFT_1292881 [Mycena rebaudengoi]
MPTATPVVKGYYRYTDIWPEAIATTSRPGDVDPLKAVLSHDALVHPQNPLHTEGVDGITMFLGTLQNGQSRLLFSSAQVEFIRYYLHAMKLTPELIPLPYSDCLLTMGEDLLNISPVVYKDGGSLRGAIKKIDKNNKRLKGSNAFLTSRRDLFERVRTLWDSKIGTWCSLDFEAWEYEHGLITECGYSYVRWEDSVEVKQQAHFRLNTSYRNGKFVPDHSQNYNFGESEIITKPGLKDKICSLISDLERFGPVFLVFHDPSQDIKYLKQLGAPIDTITPILPDIKPSEGLFIVDTASLFGALEGEGRNTRGLQQVCNHLKIETQFLHNAGNDAYYTLRALEEMASGQPLDMQREARWPNRTGEPGSTAGVKVQFQPYEEDSDFSDQEGIMGGIGPNGHYDEVTGYLVPGKL